MKKLYKIMLAALFSILCFFPLSVYADFSDDISVLSSSQVSFFNSNISYNHSNPNFVLWTWGSGDNRFICASVDFSYSDSLVSINSFVECDINGNTNNVFSSVSFSVSEPSILIYYLRVNNVDIFTSSHTLPDDIYYKVSRFITDISSSVSTGSGTFIGSITVPQVTSTLNGLLACENYTVLSNGDRFCNAYTFRNTSGIGTTGVTTPSYTLSESSSILYDTDISYNYIVETITEIYFPRNYSGYIQMSNINGVSSENSIVVDGVIHFNNVSKISISEKRSYINQSRISIPSSSKDILSYSFNAYVPDLIEVNDSLGNQLIDSGNNSSQSASSSIDTVTSSLDSSATQYEQFESQFNSSLSSSLDNIDVNSNSLVNSNDFVKTASWVKIQFDDILDSSGIYKTAISFVLIIGLALLLLGRRL